MKRLSIIALVLSVILVIVALLAIIQSIAAPECPTGQDCATRSPTRTPSATLCYPPLTPTPTTTPAAIPTLEPPNGGTIFLPLLEQPQIRLGVQLEQLDTRFVTPGGTVYYALRWHDVEAVRGVYDWQSLPFTGYHLILDVKTSPEWALPTGSKICAAPKPEYYPDLARFVVAAVEHYQPAAVSLWNEPDVPEQLAGYPEFFGCIDNPVDYSNMTIAVYDALAGRIPLIAGEFAMISLPSDYAAEFLTRTAGHFDVFAFHYYAWLPEVTGVQQRIEFIRQYYSGPLWLSETSMVCESNCGAEFEQAQDEYLRMVYALPLDYILWYTGAPNGWRNSDLIRLDGTPRPAWYTYARLTGR